MNELTAPQITILERLISAGFSIVAFPLYANAIGIRKGSCAALLNPAQDGGLQLFGEPCFLLDGNLTVRVKDKGQSWFVWKKQRLEATAERLSGLDGFVSEIKLVIEPHLP